VSWRELLQFIPGNVQARMRESGDAESRAIAKQAGSALYLANDASSLTTGIALLSDTGVSLNRG
jgi:hypothetical protein